MLTQLNYANPQTALLLRRLAWEEHVAKKALTLQHTVDDYLRAVRENLGLPPYKSRAESGGSDAFVQSLYAQGYLQSNRKNLRLLQRGWAKEWRLLRLPEHGHVRTLSRDPVYDGEGSSANVRRLRISVRDSAIPELLLTIGSSQSVAAVSANQRGVYFLGLTEGTVYIGKSDEFDVRWREHRKKLPLWAVFVSPAEHPELFTLDSLAAAEGLLISFWNEVAQLHNDNRGSDREPAYSYLQQAILFAAGASAAFLWLLRSQKLPELDLGPVLPLKDFAIPFKTWKARGWPNCYLV